MRSRLHAATGPRALERFPIDAIYSSPLQRARKTADIIAEALEMHVCFDSRLQEIHAGIFQNRRRSELAEIYPDELARWQSGDLDYTIPGGESRRQRQQRGMAAFHDIASSQHQHVAIVAHGRMLLVTIRALVQDLAGGESHPSLENGSITTLQCNGSRAFKLLAFNEINHLQHVGLAGAGDLWDDKNTRRGTPGPAAMTTEGLRTAPVAGPEPFHVRLANRPTRGRCVDASSTPRGTSWPGTEHIGHPACG
jgi:broad specificity phosphatase PhoE